jgi:hypothetical protein
VRRFFVERSARRFVGLSILIFFTVPFGLSVIGCGHKSAPPVYCNGLDSGPVVGQVKFISLEPNLATLGESLNFGQIGSLLSASATDCNGNSVSVSKFTYSTNDSTLKYADINPSTGAVCAGNWNRQSGSGIPDYTICTAPSTPPPTNEFLITANADSASSNAIPVFVHPTVTAVQLAPSCVTAGTCVTDPSSVTSDFCTNVTTTPEQPAPGYDGTSCVSQNDRVQLTAKVFSNGNNITCQVGHLTFAAEGAANIVGIDANGFGTANQPGSATITASVSNSQTASSAGFFSTCPPKSIVLSATGAQAGQNPVNLPLNNSLPLNATVLDTNGNPITGLSLEFNSTTPQTISAGGGAVLPTFPGSATITAICQPGTCNPAPLSQVGYLGNGTPLTSNGITVNTAGTSSTVIYMASTSSQYVVPYDFTVSQQGSPIKLPYVPNSMVISQDGSSIYLGSPQGLMTIATTSNQVTGPAQSIPGVVLAVSPDGGTVVVTDPTRQTVSLVASGAVSTSYGNVVGTSAAWSPDSQTVYITTTSNTLLTHSIFNNWRAISTDETYSDVAVTVPHVGAYFASPTGKKTEGRSYCTNTTLDNSTSPPAATQEYFPLADQQAVPLDELTYTADGQHLLGATAQSSPAVLEDFNVVLPSTACPQVVAEANGTSPTPIAAGYFKSTYAPHPLANITASSITGVDAASNSQLAFVTYTGSSGQLPFYEPAAGTVKYLQLGNGATANSAPVAGVFSTDNLTFYAGTGSASGSGTSADDDVHLITMTYPSSGAPTITETGILSPNLANASGSGYAPVNLIVQKPKRVQS